MICTAVVEHIKVKNILKRNEMKKIIPFFSKVYSVILYIDKNTEPCIAYSAYNIFNRNRTKQKLKDMSKLHFTDVDSANLYLAIKIYPNIVWDGLVENVTFGKDEQEEFEYTTTGSSVGGSGRQFYFAGIKNLDRHYFGFYMPKEKLVRREILAKHKHGKSK